MTFAVNTCFLDEINWKYSLDASVILSVPRINARSYIELINRFILNMVFIMIIITLFQEDKIFIMYADLTNGPQLNITKVDMSLTIEDISYLQYVQSKKISNDQELIQSDPTSCPQNQKGNN